jgi:N-methylhydantoinase A
VHGPSSPGPARESREQTVTFWAEARYPEQMWELEVTLPTPRFAGPQDVAALADVFHRTHEEVFAIRDADAPIEIVGWSVSVACRIRGDQADCWRSQSLAAPAKAHAWPILRVTAGFQRFCAASRRLPQANR